MLHIPQPAAGNHAAAVPAKPAWRRQGQRPGREHANQPFLDLSSLFASPTGIWTKLNCSLIGGHLLLEMRHRHLPIRPLLDLLGVQEEAALADLARESRDIGFYQ